MTGWITSALFFAAAACSAAAEPPIVVGAVASQTGAHAAAGDDYRRGLLAWEAQVNAGGGLLGRRVELRVADDGSEGARAGRAYAELITGGADVLIGPFGSAATLAAVAEAERSHRILLNAAGPAGIVQSRAPKYVFQVVPPYAAYADGVVAIAQAAGATSLFIVGRDDAASREMAEAAQARAREMGFAHVALEIYSGSVADFLPQIYKAMLVQADAWIAFGEVRDGADMVKTFKREGYVPGLFYARSSPEPGFIALVGQDAEYVLGSEEYDVRFATPGNAAFVQAFTARWSRPPGPPAAAAYAAGTVLAAAVREAGTVDSEKLRIVLGGLELDTVLGSYRVDRKTGAQVGIKPAVTQIVRGRAQPVWPAGLADGRAVVPFLAWSARQVIR